jgi:hypothetical protein
MSPWKDTQLVFTSFKAFNENNTSLNITMTLSKLLSFTKTGIGPGK